MKAKSGCLILIIELSVKSELNYIKSSLYESYVQGPRIQTRA